MYVLMIAYVLLVLIRPQDYPAWMASMSTWYVQQTVLGAAAVMWLLSSRKTFSAPQYWLLGVFLIVLMVSNIANGWLGGALVQLTKFAPVVMAFIVLSNAIRSPARMRAFMAVFSLGAAVLAVHGIDQAQTGVGWTGMGLSQGTRIQYVGIFSDPNDLGMLFVTCLPMAMYLGLRKQSAVVLRLFWLAIAGVLVFATYLTNSRGALVALVALLCVYLWRTRGIFAAGALGAAAAAGAVVLPSRLQQLSVSEASAAGRVDTWYEGMHMFFSRPIFGIGADSYSDMYHLTAHNSYVLVLAETGIIGFTVWLAFVGYCFRMVLVVLGQRGRVPGALPDATPDPRVEAQWHDDRAATFALLLALFGFFVAAFFLSRSYVVTLYLLAALVVGHYLELRRRWPSLPDFRLSRDVVRWAVISPVAIVCLYGVVKVLLALS